jgi:hypothetical protein
LLVCSNCHREVHYGLHPDDELKRKILPTHKVRCFLCNSEFPTKKDDQMFCSHKCSQLSSRKVDRPDRETLACDIENMNWLAIGRKYKVSDNAVRKWARAYGLIT